LVKSQLLYRLS